MNKCCINSGENFFRNKYPLEGPIEEDYFLTYIKDLCKKWGDITNFAINTENFYIRTTSSPQFGINAKAGTLKCNTCSKPFDYILLGSRLYYFIWRINMLCSTYWEKSEKSEYKNMMSLTGDSSWPDNEHLEQIKIAFKMYFGKESLLDTKGLYELNKKIYETSQKSIFLYLYITDLSELFILFHELQHIIPIKEYGIAPIGISIHLPDNLDITSKRGRNWITELNCDANSLYLLFLSVANIFSEKFGLSLNDAKTQAASIVCTGADSALHVLQVLEEQLFGKVTMDDAVYRNEFKHHPPTEFRRKSLSYTSYFLVTGKKIESLFRNEFTESWRIVANNVRSHMIVRDILFNNYMETRSKINESN